VDKDPNRNQRQGKDREKDKDPGPADAPLRRPEMDELYRRLQPELRRPKPSPEAIAAALEAAQRLATEADAEHAADHSVEQVSAQQLSVQELSGDPNTIVCGVCGYQNRQGNKFCGMCGIAVTESPAPESEISPPANLPVANPKEPEALTPSSNTFLEPDPAMRPPSTRPTGQETHHYHHHYHHHYFPGGEAIAARSAAEPARDSVRDSLREEKFRPTAALRGDLSRAEAAVRRIAHEWVLACNTKHLDDLLELYTADALVLRSNCPPLRGASAVHEFFFGALDAGLGEVELEPLRVEVVGELAYEGGRFKALIPSATGKRREERGKYLWVCARQGNGEWRVTADCWSSDLTLTTLESDIPQGAAVKTSQPRKNV
jgi:ketosteroid isomerase-like protein